MANKQTYELFSKLKLVTQNNYIDRVKQQLGEYFSGQRNKFDLNVVFNGTEFQQQVWRTLLDLPYGSTASYEEQAIRIGGKEKVRAVGTANGANPISIVVPCHRVIGKNGSLTGFAGGLSTKGFLLDLENKSSSSKALE
jgi:methylated-DNA-[protein]-cysteine S-methyltransferase